MSTRTDTVRLPPAAVEQAVGNVMGIGARERVRRVTAELASIRRTLEPFPLRFRDALAAIDVLTVGCDVLGDSLGG